MVPEYATKLYLSGSSSHDLRSVESPFMGITLRSTLTQSVSTVRVQSMSQIDLFKICIQ